MAHGPQTSPVPTNWLSGLRDLYLASGEAAPVLAARTQQVEEVLLDGWRRILQPAFPTGLSLVAVGGYGRRELFPYSDVDLLFLIEKPPAAGPQRDAISEFLRAGWDAGLRLSHSVHTVADCCELNTQNVELTISLLDQRLLAGDTALHAQLGVRLPKFLQNQRQALVQHLGRLARERSAKFQDTIYHLEPNIKETPGGLRDYHLLHWLAQAGAAPAIPAELAPAWAFLAATRCWLHFEVGRDSNLLSYELQDQLSALPFAVDHDPASWMRQYFRHARQIWRTAQRTLEIAEGTPGNLLRQFRDWRSRLSNAEFTVAHERVLLRFTGALASDPEIALRLFTFVARHGVRLAPDTERRIEEALPVLAAHFATARDVWHELAVLLSQPHAALALTAMHDTGFLAVLLPEWKNIDCLVVRDFYHRYTVDEHTLVAAGAVCQLRSEKEGLRARFAELLAEIPRPAILLLAILLHDLGKGGGGNHSEASIRLGGPALERLGVPVEIRNDVLSLIENHLDLSTVMTSRDLTDPATARWIADRIGTIERLKLLTILTYADISAVNPTAMTPWRLEQLWRTYLLGNQELTRELDSDRIHQPSVETPAMSHFLDGFPTRYLRIHSALQVREHFKLSDLASAAGVGIDLVRREGTWHLVVITRDRPGLFASIAGGLASFGMNILRAEAFSNTAHLVLDTFAFSDPMRTLELNPTEVDRLRQVLTDAILGRTDIRRVLKARRPLSAPVGPRVEPRVNFDGQASETATLIELVAQDRTGLLYDLASAISESGCNIEVVLIDTEAHKALDVFYVTAGGGHKLDTALQASLRERLLAACRA